MSLQQSYIALDWVKDALDETLAEVQSKLQEHTPLALQSACESLHLVSGTLHMAQLNDTLLLSEMMEKVIQAVVKGRLQFTAVEDVVTSSITLLIEELDYLQTTKSSRTAEVQQQVDALGQLLSNKPSERSVSFVPDLSLVEDQFVVAPQSGQALPKLAQIYQHLLAVWLAGDTSDQVLFGMVRVAGLLQQNVQTREQAALWHVASTLHQVMANGYLVDVRELSPLLIRLERSLPVSTTGVDVNREKALLGDILQILDPQKISDPQVQQLRQLYGLDLPEYHGASRRLLDSALRQVLQARDGLSVSRDAAAIALREAVRLLEVSGWHTLAQDAQVELQRLLTDYSSDRVVVDKLAQDLTNFINKLQQTIDLTSAPSTSSESSIVQDARHAVVRESRSAIEKVKSALATYHQGRGNVAALETVPELLMTISGAFSMLGLSRAANLLSATVTAMQETVLKSDYVAHWKQAELLAQLISAIEYYLDQLAGQYQDDRILDAAEQTLVEFKQPQGQAIQPAPVGGDKLYHDETTLTPSDEHIDLPVEHEIVDVAAETIELAHDAPPTEPASTESPVSESVLSTATIADAAEVVSENPFNDDFGQDDEIREIFIEEAHEVLENIAQDYPKWKADFANEKALKEIRRAFHTLKGSGRMVGARTVGELAWAIESLLNRVLDQTVQPGNQVTGLIDEVYAALPSLISSYTEKQPNSHAVNQQVNQWIVRSSDLILQRPTEDAPLVQDEAEYSREEGIADAPHELPKAAPKSAVQVTAKSADELLPLELLSDQAPKSVPADNFATLDDDETILEIFLEEATDVLKEISEQFPLWAVDFANLKALKEMRRAYHTLKGSGRMVGANVIGELAWSVERLLNSVLEGSIQANQHIVQLLGEVQAIIPTLVQDFSAKRDPHINVMPIIQVAWLLRDGHALTAGQIQTAVQQAAEHGQPVDDQQALMADFDTLAASFSEPVPTTAKSAESASAANQELSIEDLDPQLLEIFVTEAEGYLKDIQTFTIEHMAAEDVMVSDVLLRALHTLRGSAGMTGIESIYQLGHVMEHECKRLMREHLAMGDDHLDALVELVRLVTLQVHMLQNGQMPLLDSACDEFIVRVEALTPKKKHAGEEDASEQVFTGLVTELMDLGIDDVLDAEWTLREHLAQPDVMAHVATLQEQLHQLVAAVKRVPIAPLTALVTALDDFYLHLEKYPALLHVSSSEHSLVDDLLAGHMALTRMFDSLAASQQVKAEEEVLKQLAYWQTQTPVAEAAPVQTAVATPVTASSTPITPVTHVLTESSTPASVSPADENYPIDRDNDAELLDIFMEEAEELVQEVDVSFSDWAADTKQIEPLKALQRHLHTLKGGARMAQVQSLGDFTHELETIYERLVEGQQQSSDVLIRFLRHAQDIVAQQVEQLRQSQTSFFTPNEMQAVQLYIKTRDTKALQGYFEQIDLARHAVIENASPAFDTTTHAEKIVVPEPTTPVTTIAEAVAQAAAPVVSATAKPVATAKAKSKKEVVDETPKLRQMQVLAEAWDEGSAPDPEVLEIFLDEAADIIDQTSAELAQWLTLAAHPDPEQGQNSPQSKKLLQELQRNLHTFKGGARMAGVDAPGDLSHEMEFVYEDLALGRKPVTVEIGQLLNQSHDWLADAVTVLDRGERPQMPHVLIDALRAYRKDPASLVSLMAHPELVPTMAPVPKVSPKVDHAELAGQVTHDHDDSDFANEPPPVEGLFPAKDTLDVSSAEMVRVSAGLMEKMINLAGENAITRARIEMGLTGVSATVEEMGSAIQRIAEQLRRMDVELESQIIARHQEEMIQSEIGGYQDFDPLEMDQYSSINQLSKSLAESVSDLLDFKNTLVEKARDSEGLLLQQSRVQSELQEGLMSSRLVPFSRLVPRLQRVVRQTATELGKPVDLVIQNAEGELDRSVLERMTAPLEHMLRNAVDHGMESAADRIKQGKPEKGTITLSVLREGSEVIITLQDDGRGINVDAVRNKAIERGIINADAVLTPAEVMQLIFHAGLSTAQQVTQISGRGVGMDVVQSEIRQLGGVVIVGSEEGKGTHFTVRLPLTVAVTDALRVRVGDRVFAVSLSQIERIVRVSPSELEKFYNSDQELFNFDHKPYRLRYLGDLLGGSHVPTLYGHVIPLPLLLVKYEGQNVAIQVDQLVGSREEVVIKPVGLQLSSVSSISGATILGDGSVVIILDLAALARSAIAQKRTLTAKIDIEETPTAPVKRKKMVMVVDDSVTVRKVTTRLLERHGYQVIQAKDGVDAMSKLEDVSPDLMLLDIEMPRMDGFEVANLVRHNPRLSELPIIMITSRTGEKHREHAYSIGVNGYMGKPFQELILIENIAELLAESDVVE